MCKYYMTAQLIFCSNLWIGDREVDIFIKEVVVVSLNLPPMTIDDFFGENIVENLATFLDIPSNKIRIVDIVTESSKRRKRESEGIILNIEIGKFISFFFCIISTFF